MKFVLDIEPKPQSRPRFARKGNFVSTYEDKGMKQWRTLCRGLVQAQWTGQPLETALKAEVCFYIAPPAYVAKPKRNQQALADETLYVPKKPDIDNYIKSLFDSCSGILFKDDGQIAELTACKKYSYQPRIELKITEI